MLQVKQFSIEGKDFVYSITYQKSNSYPRNPFFVSRQNVSFDTTESLHGEDFTEDLTEQLLAIFEAIGTLKIGVTSVIN